MNTVNITVDEQIKNGEEHQVIKCFQGSQPLVGTMIDIGPDIVRIETSGPAHFDFDSDELIRLIKKAQGFDNYEDPFSFESNIEPDFGWGAPVRTKKPCEKPQFADTHLHRVAIMKDEHWGSPGDGPRNDGGCPGWVTKKVCDSCGREFTGSSHSVFVVDKKPEEEE